MASHGLCRWHRQQIFHQRHWHQWQFTACVVKTDGKFAAGDTATSEKSGINSGEFATGVDDTCGVPWVANISYRIFEKKKSEELLGPRGGPGEDNKYFILVLEKMCLYFGI